MPAHRGRGGTRGSGRPGAGAAATATRAGEAAGVGVGHGTLRGDPPARNHPLRRASRRAPNRNTRQPPKMVRAAWLSCASTFEGLEIS
jgi:hypothetical protein